jgi:hypothetical protein
VGVHLKSNQQNNARGWAELTLLDVKASNMSAMLPSKMEKQTEGLTKHNLQTLFKGMVHR